MTAALTTPIIGLGTAAIKASILGFATAHSSVGLEVEAGGTAFSKTMIQMQVAVETGDDSVEHFARVAGVTAEEFIARWKADPSSAIEKFIVGLSKMDEQGITALVSAYDEVSAGADVSILTPDAITGITSGRTGVVSAMSQTFREFSCRKSAYVWRIKRCIRDMIEAYVEKNRAGMKQMFHGCDGIKRSGGGKQCAAADCSCR